MGEPFTLKQASQQRRIDCRTRSKTPSISRLLAAATEIHGDKIGVDVNGCLTDHSFQSSPEEEIQPTQIG